MMNPTFERGANPSVVLSQILARSEGPGKLLSATDFALAAGQAATYVTEDNTRSFLSIINHQMDRRGFSEKDRDMVHGIVQNQIPQPVEP